MITKCVVFPNDSNGIAVIHPAHADITVDQLIQAVPTGKPYRIIESSELPADRGNRDAWTCDFTTKDGVAP